MTETQNIKGMQIEILKEGTGDGVTSGKSVSVHYAGELEDGTLFDSSVPRGKPFTLTLGAHQVIEGWELGIVGMKVGEKRKLTIPSDLAYGDDGYPGVIPPKATLIFTVELISIN
jgi:FKBP-type peptidyl-prolyl cis-trans isomerase